MPDLHDPFTVAWVTALQAALPVGGAEVARAVSALGGAWGIVLGAGATRLLAGRRPSYAVLGALAHEVPLYLVLTFLVRSARPAGPGLTPFEHVGVMSFPSGHVALATVMFGVLAREKLVPRWVAIAVPLVVALARFVMGMHYLADLAGGLVLGAVVLAVTRRSWPVLEAWLAKRTLLFFALFALVNVAIVLVVVSVVGWSATGYQSAGLTAGIAAGLLLDARRRSSGTEPSALRHRVMLLGGALPAVVMLTRDEASLPGPLLGAVAAGTAVWLFAVGPRVAEGRNVSKRGALPSSSRNQGERNLRD